MPEAPDFHYVPQHAYIVNYFLMGCEPPQYLYFELSKEPATDLALLFLLPDAQDIGQEIIQPRHGKNKRAERHGRKRAKSRGIPDISAIIGNVLRGKLNPGNKFNIAPLRVLFRVWNVYEGVNFAFAVIDGLTDIAFANFWGMSRVYQNHCTHWPRISKSMSAPFTVGGAGPPMTSFAVSVVEFNDGFDDEPFGTNTNLGAYTITLHAVVKAISIGTENHCRLALGFNNHEIIAVSDQKTIPYGDVAHFELTASVEANQFVGWGLSDRDGVFEVLSCDVLAFENKLLF